MDIVEIKKLVNKLYEDPDPFTDIKIRLFKHILYSYEKGLASPYRILDQRLMMYCDHYETSDNRYYRNILELMINGKGVLTIKNQNKEKSAIFNKTAKFVWMIEQIYLHELPQDTIMVKTLLIDIVKLLEKSSKNEINLDLVLDDHFLKYLYKYIDVIDIPDSLIEKTYKCMINVNPFII